MAFDPMEQRRIMGCFATGVTVLTTVAGGESRGMTANAVTSLSLDPPLVMVAVDKDAQMHGYLSGSRYFALNILSEDQEALSTQFARPGPKDFSNVPTTTVRTGMPVFVEALGYVECRLVEVLRAGDHDIFVGEIVAGDAVDGRPLLFYRGKYRRMMEEPPHL
jgi:flavin reductase (DIM6/NTAB) family NADH-FMN oxidoreductase RutF